jgi:5-methylcytosine-specific restriction endonuclease McrA
MNHYDRVRVNNPHVQSLAALLLLNLKLRENDKTCDWKQNRGFRKRYLAAFKKHHGVLFCEYCGKRPLLVDGEGLTLKKGKILKEFLATLDHIVPLSRGGAEFDPANIKLCCPQCNRDKDNKSIVEFAGRR